ncbi:MAG TPA: DUF2461 domain-containing protein [Polyangia bacterium]|nr:DUF2461 domain-containing protein [Polyangia bacterium]
MTFPGFPKQTVRFVAGLRDNNDRAWFEAHRADYQQALLNPAVAFIQALAPRLRKIDPDIQVEPRVNGSILRINRDIRFAKDKSPYKDHLDLWFWTGERKGWESSGFFFRLSCDRLLLGAGMHQFTAVALPRYRAAVRDARRGAALTALVSRLRRAGYQVGTEAYKRLPPGVPADHPRAALLRHGGLHASWQGRLPRELGTAAFVPFAARHFAALAPLHRWLRSMRAGDE